jgi:hypothetical protein
MLGLKRYPKRSPIYYVRGTMNGIEIFESTHTDDKALAQAYLDKKISQTYCQHVLEPGSWQTISKEMRSVLIDLCAKTKKTAQPGKTNPIPSPSNFSLISTLNSAASALLAAYHFELRRRTATRACGRFLQASTGSTTVWATPKETCDWFAASPISR